MTRGAAALALFASAAVLHPAVAAGIGDADVLALVRRHCGACHAASPTHPAMKETPKGVVLETVADLKKHAQSSYAQTVETRAMPLGNETGMTEAERAALGRWLKANE
ncbi:MAG: hypothetical protein ACK4UO_03465 [Pseudolabrys sp.]